MAASPMFSLIHEIFFSGKILTSLWSIFIFFMTAIYLSNLRSFIISPLFEKPIDTLQDVVDRLQQHTFIKILKHTVCMIIFQFPPYMDSFNANG